MGSRGGGLIRGMASSGLVSGASLKFQNVLVVIKQTAFEEYSQVSMYICGVLGYELHVEEQKSS
jgi:hypothetical protein